MKNRGNVSPSPPPQGGREPFAQVQRRFAAHLRDPESQPAPPDVEDRRMKIYRELFYNNVEGFIASAFPVLRKLTDDAHWHAMLRNFYARHRCHTPLFYRIAEEFLEYLEKERGAVPGDPPFLRELAHYEWVELALSVAEDKPDPRHADPNGDLLAGIPVVSLLAWLLAYEFPVHRIGPSFQPQQPGPQTYLVVYRTRQDEVKFMEVNAVAARLLELVQAEPAAGRAQLQRIAQELKHPQPEAVLAEGARILADFRARDILLGTMR